MRKTLKKCLCFALMLSLVLYGGLVPRSPKAGAQTYPI